MKQKEFDKAYENFAAIDEAIRRVGEKFLEVTENSKGVYLQGYEADDGGVTLYGEEDSHCSCCSNPNYETYMPFSHLWTDWEGDIKKAKAEVAAAKKEKNRKKKELARKLKEINDRKTYEKLQKKFGDEK